VEQNQSTIVYPVHLSGIGIHSGQESYIIIRPAPVDHGIVFIRSLHNGERVQIQALGSQTYASDLCTTLGQGEARLETIEHLMAAIHACEIDNLEIEVSHTEMPILDGSALPFIKALQEAGRVSQHQKRTFLRIIKPLRLDAAPSFAEFLPCIETSSSCHFDISIDFTCPLIGYQQISFELSQDFFRGEIAPARTFGFLHQARMLREQGLALGADKTNCLIIGDDNQLLDGQNLRFFDEFVRHKALDSVGDTALLGVPFLGIFRSHRPSHRLNGEIVKALLSSPDHFEIIS